MTAKEDALILLCDLLAEVIRSFQQWKEDEVGEDLSYIWRPAIEDHNQNQNHGLKDLLVSIVRDTAEALMQTNGGMILEIIENQPFKVFKRIGFHLRRNWPEIDSEGTANLMVDENIFNDNHFHHELYLLLSEQFNNLPRKNQETYLSLVAQGVDTKRWLDNREQGHQPSQQEADRFVRFWQYTKLIPIQSFLNQECQTKFEALKEEFGELEHPDFHFSRSTSWEGPTSPKDVKELSSMKIDELISFLKSWKPSEDPFGPSPEGLGRELTGIVSLKPEIFATEASRFKKIDPTYVRALILGFHEALKQKKSFDWQPVLELFQWVIDQHLDIPIIEEWDVDQDLGWGQTRKAIAELFSIAFNVDTQDILFDQRTLVWQILKSLTDDPDPTPEHEAQYGGSNMDSATLSINTTRGVAMHTVIRYALWVRRHIEVAQDGEDRIEKGFEEMPEVEDILDYHLNPSNDASLAIRAIYGQWLPWLIKLDLQWVVQNIEEIFPQDETLQNLYGAAWETYIIYCAPYDNTLDLLQREYRL
ncbi:MAG: hypothetical protein MUO43_03410, partial [Desulfobacterales bacterium]|nr:hypothetical protein [Desulfobacterales bacterium]